jgi:predicted mannosyl-3-phosphoglycerate phosphatase (HAD superfamily)
VQDGLPPIFGEVVCDITPSKATADHSYTEAGFESIEAEEVINQLRTEFQKLDIMFNCENWDKSNRELSDLTGVPRRTVHWCRQELLRRYREMTA